MADNLPVDHQSKRYADCEKSTNAVRAALVTMRTMVRVRATDTEDLMLQVEAYRRKLLAYPVKDVLVVLERWPDDHEFWPSWHDLKTAMDERYAAIQARQALEYKPQQPQQESDNRPPPSRAEIEDCLVKLGDTNEQFLVRLPLIKLGRAMLARRE